MKKAEISFAFSFLALKGKNDAFIPQVHIEKNHTGEIKFAKRILDYIQLLNPVIFSIISAIALKKP